MNIYFSGIGGVGIGPLAEITHDMGYAVAGSDHETSLTTDMLLRKGITVSFNQDGAFLKQQHQDKPIDWFIYTAALPKNHPELLLASKLGIKTAKRDELLAHIIKDRKLKLIAIAGTHGKTTTTGMMIWAMQTLNIPISYSVGTTIKFGPSGKFDPKSEYFVYECDEFDRNFLHFEPYLSIITSIDYDHPDTYSTPDDYLSAFRQFAKNSQKTITWRDQHGEIFAELQNVDIVDQTQIDDKFEITGEHNRRNATLTKKALEYLNVKTDVYEIIKTFPGTGRRFEKLADNLYSDYGHHPVEIASTLQLANELSDDITLVYQPHQNIRQHEIKDQYIDQFIKAKKIYWLPTYLSREDPKLPILEPKDLIQHIINKSDVEIVNFDDDLWSKIEKARSQNSLVLCMGAGRIDGWVREKLKSN